MRSSGSRFWLSIRIAVAGALLAAAAAGETRTEFLITQLKTSDDFRVRTQAALGLGASGEDAAVQPLCGALDDTSEAVRGAAAAALGKLGKPEGLPCLKSKQDGESNASVKSQIAKSIKTLGGGGGGKAMPANARVYVSLGKTTNKTGRDTDDVDGLVRGAMTSKLSSMDGYAVAPKDETSGSAKKVIAEKKLLAFQLSVTVEKPVYDGDRLTVAIKVLMTSYPGKDLKGEFAPRLTQSGTSSGDRASEDLLIKMALERALESFGKVVASM